MNRLFLPVRTVPTAFQNIESPFDRLFSAATGRDDASPSGYIPSMDVYEHEDKIEICMDSPGVAASDLQLEMKDKVLTISGERSAPCTNENARAWHCGISYGKFQRMISLPENANCDAIEATYEAGVLKVVVPKVPKPAPTMIQVRTTEPATVSSS